MEHKMKRRISALESALSEVLKGHDEVRRTYGELSCFNPESASYASHLVEYEKALLLFRGAVSDARDLLDTTEES